MHSEVGMFFSSILIESFEDIPLQASEMEDINNIMNEIKDLVHKVQSFIDFFVAAENAHDQEVGILDLALSNLLPKFEFLNIKIKEHYFTVSKLSSVHMAPRTAMVSLFIVDSVLDDLMYLINNKSHVIDGLDDQIVKLHKELMFLGSYAHEIAEQQQQAEHEQLSVQTIDIAQEVEFVINSLPPVWYLTLRLPQLIHKIQLIAMDIRKIKKQIVVAREEQVEKYEEEQGLSPSKRTPVLEENLVGFKELGTEIAEQLFGGTKRLQIISIFGMPGLGKTTFANKLYNHPSAVNRFHCRAWCVSSQTHNVRNMLVDILKSLGHLKGEDEKDEKNDEKDEKKDEKNEKKDEKDEKKDEKDQENIKEDEDLGGKVYKFIKGRRYLLVIDDIWDINAWNDLKRYFPDDGIGSRILFTTRNREVGLEASASIVKELPFLSNAECWELLRRKVFQAENRPQELFDIGEKIATKCRGLPLAVVVIAGILANMEKKECLWQKVESSLSSHIVGSSHNCMQILELSYKHLPLNLKPCFLYFGAFEEDAEISVQMLTSTWIAQRFIKKKKGKSLEDVAVEYLVKLIDRSLVLVSKRRSNRQVKTCKIHDLLLNMCSRIVEENCFLKAVKLIDYDRVSYQHHHCLSIIFNRDKSLSYIPLLCIHVRSLLCADAIRPMLFSRSFNVLRVLHFYKNILVSFVIGMEHTVQLRYLAIKSEIEALPIQKFHRLEFLEVDNKHAAEITKVLLDMVNLRCMHFKGGAYFSDSCRRQATNEESFQVNNKVLQSIAVVNMYDEIDEKILRCFPNLRRLEAILLVQGSFKFSFDFLGQLETLKLTTMSNFGSISLPSNLKHLTLFMGQISPQQMEIIGRLEYLEFLKLEGVEIQKEQWDTSEVEFARLEVLKLKRVKISKWNSSSHNFPSLQKLILECCHGFKIPSDFGDSPTLERIEAHWCGESVEESAKQIGKEQEDSGNEVLTVLINNEETSEFEGSEISELSELTDLSEDDEFSDYQTGH